MNFSTFIQWNTTHQLKGVSSWSLNNEDLKKYFFSIFWGPHPQHMEVPRLGSIRSCSHWPTPKPQQRGIRAVSVNYTTAHSNVGSLTHWVRPGIEPASSWILVRFVTTEPQRKLQISAFKNKTIKFQNWQHKSIILQINCMFSSFFIFFFFVFLGSHP